MWAATRKISSDAEVVTDPLARVVADPFIAQPLFGSELFTR